MSDPTTNALFARMAFSVVALSLPVALLLIWSVCAAGSIRSREEEKRGER